MIWIPNQAIAPPGGAPLTAHIQSVIEENCADLPELDALQVRELAAAVATYASASAESGMYVESGCLVMMASRALSSVGASKAAHRVLVFGTGLVHPSEWTIRGDDSVWTIDLGQMTVRDAASLELAFFNSLNMIIDCVAEVWDSTQGRGTLGLRRLDEAASGILQHTHKRKLAAFADEVCRACRAKLVQTSKKRGWRHSPDLLIVGRS